MPILGRRFRSCPATDIQVFATGDRTIATIVPEQRKSLLLNQKNRWLEPSIGVGKSNAVTPAFC